MMFGLNGVPISSPSGSGAVVALRLQIQLGQKQGRQWISRIGRQAQHVAGAVADEGLRLGGEAGDDRLAALAGRDRLAGIIEHFDDVALAHQQHLAAGGLVRGEADVAAAEFVGHRRAEDFAELGWTEELIWGH